MIPYTKPRKPEEIESWFQINHTHDYLELRDIDPFQHIHLMKGSVNAVDRPQQTWYTPPVGLDLANHI